jgi:hypothetical protein
MVCEERCFVFLLRRITWFILETNVYPSDDTYAKDRIKSARLKLTGINPAVITGYVGKKSNDSLSILFFSFQGLI